MTSMEFTEKVAVVTGGGSGIGEAAALRLAERGARVAVCGRTKEKLDDTVRKSDQSAGEMMAVQADVSEEGDVRRMYEQVMERWGRVDVVFAHAGINGVWARIEEIEPDDWDKTIRVNLRGTFLTIRYGVPHLKGRGGAIIITSSINGTTKFSDLGSTAYSATKAGQIAMMKLLALELGEHNVRVNAICPGRIATDIGERTERRGTKATAEVAEYPKGDIPLTGGQSGTSAQVAELVCFLASDRASHITGTPVWIDGGQSLIQG